MSDKFTPGPWTTDLNSDENCVSIKSHLKGDGYFAGIATVTQRDSHPCKDVEITRAECRANAQLMAAAPDLLEALRGVLRVADRATSEFDAARAAIAKAVQS